MQSSMRHILGRQTKSSCGSLLGCFTMKLSCKALHELSFDLLSGLPEHSSSQVSITLKGTKSSFDGVHGEW